jgi:hypothetical protein
MNAANPQNVAAHAAAVSVMKVWNQGVRLDNVHAVQVVHLLALLASEFVDVDARETLRVAVDLMRRGHYPPGEVVYQTVYQLAMR